PRQMGKSSLMVRIANKAFDLNKKVAVLDFQLFDEQTRSNADLFFRRFAGSISENLDMPDVTNEFWQHGTTNPQTCTRYLEQEILKKLSTPFTFVVDEAERMFGSPFREDFFSMIRAWHNNRGNPIKRWWAKLDIVLVASTEPNMFIDS